MPTQLLEQKPTGEIPAQTLSAGLDYYKPTMSQFIHNHEPLAEATFTFKNRGSERLLDYVDPTVLSERLNEVRRRGFEVSELNYLRQITDADGKRMFGDDYLAHIETSSLPEVNIDTIDDDIAISTTGDWSMASFWETVVMSELNELYFESYLQANNIDAESVYDEGDRLLTEKIEYLQQHPEIQLAEFGTRRRFSLRWQSHMLERLKTECPENLTGTSNVALANKFGLRPVGTFAHELPMGYAGLADARGEDVRGSHGKMLDEWYDFYGDELAIALSDTFGSDFFLQDFTPERAQKYRGTRHDSGDPFEYGHKTVAHYRKLGIVAIDKLLLYSDGLTVWKSGDLAREFADEIQTPFGIGTHVSNDLGLKALNIVMKLTHIADTTLGVSAGTVKLSDNPGKHTGSPQNIAAYKHYFAVS